MEKLSRIHVQGFRSLRDVDLEVRDLNVLIGANGTGKSNLIEFLALLQRLLTFDLQVHVTRKGGASALLHYGAKRTPELRATLVGESGERSITYELALVPAEPDRFAIQSESLAGTNRASDVVEESIRSSGGFESRVREIETDDVPTRTMVTGFADFIDGMQLFHFHDTTSTARIRTTHDLRRRRFLAGDGGNLAAFLYGLRSTHRPHYDAIVSTVRLAVPYFTDFVLEPEPENPSSILLHWRDRNPDYVFGSHQLSDGSLRAIALITALMSPQEMLPSLVVIDEPELGLHPSAVGLIGSLIKAVAMKRQVIVATQSSTLVAEFRPEDVVVVERDEDEAGYGESTFERLSPEALGDWVKDYDLGTLYEMNVTGGGPQ